MSPQKQKLNIKSPTSWIQVKLEKIKLKLNQSGNFDKKTVKPIFEIFIDTSNFDVKLGSDIGVSCIEVGVKIQSLILIDHTIDQYDVYDPKTNVLFQLN